MAFICLFIELVYYMHMCVYAHSHFNFSKNESFYNETETQM